MLNDVYYDKDYCGLYLQPDDEIFEFTWKKEDKILKNVAIKRPIKKISRVNISDNYYDLETPYGYGGFITNTNDMDFVEKGLNEYQNYCKENKIIAEFIRFNPFNDFPEKNKHFFDFFSLDRWTVYVDLKNGYDTVYLNYKSSLKRNLKKAFNNRLQFKILDKNQHNLENFFKLYFKTMEKNKASSFYFFPKEYFINLFKLEYVKLFGVLKEDQIINMMIILESFPISYYHLGASNPEFYALNGNPFLFDKVIQYYIDQKFEVLFLGGGSNSDPENSLLRFKKKFSPLMKPFYISGKIYNAKKYEEYCSIHNAEYPGLREQKYFLKYRLTPEMIER